MCINNFHTQRFIPGSFAWKIEWSIRTVFPFIISAICCIYFAEYLLVPFLLPIIVLVACNASIGTTFFVFTSVHKGGFFVSIISSIFYWIPFANIHWSFSLIYFFVTSFIFAILLHKNAGSLKIGLAFHVINTLQFATNKDMKFYDIWWLYSVLPITLIICFIGLYLPFFQHNFGTLHVLYCETQLSIKLLQEWVDDMFKFFLNCNINDADNNGSTTTEITANELSTSQSNRTRIIGSKHKLVRAKLQKYLTLSNNNKAQIYQPAPIARRMYFCFLLFYFCFFFNFCSNLKFQEISTKIKTKNKLCISIRNFAKFLILSRGINFLCYCYILF